MHGAEEGSAAPRRHLHPSMMFNQFNKTSNDAISPTMPFMSPLVLAQASSTPKLSWDASPHSSTVRMNNASLAQTARPSQRVGTATLSMPPQGTAALGTIPKISPPAQIVARHPHLMNTNSTTGGTYYIRPSPMAPRPLESTQHVMQLNSMQLNSMQQHSMQHVVPNSMQHVVPNNIIPSNYPSSIPSGRPTTVIRGNFHAMPTTVVPSPLVPQSGMNASARPHTTHLSVFPSNGHRPPPRAMSGKGVVSQPTDSPTDDIDKTPALTIPHNSVKRQAATAGRISENASDFAEVSTAAATSAWSECSKPISMFQQPSTAGPPSLAAVHEQPHHAAVPAPPHHHAVPPLGGAFAFPSDTSFQQHTDHMRLGHTTRGPTLTRHTDPSFAFQGGAIGAPMPPPGEAVGMGELESYRQYLHAAAMYNQWLMIKLGEMTADHRSMPFHHVHPVMTGINGHTTPMSTFSGIPNMHMGGMGDFNKSSYTPSLTSSMVTGGGRSRVHEALGRWKHNDPHRMPTKAPKMGGICC